MSGNKSSNLDSFWIPIYIYKACVCASARVSYISVKNAIPDYQHDHIIRHGFVASRVDRVIEWRRGNVEILCPILEVSSTQTGVGSLSTWYWFTVGAAHFDFSIRENGHGCLFTALERPAQTERLWCLLPKVVSAEWREQDPNKISADPTVPACTQNQEPWTQHVNL